MKNRVSLLITVGLLVALIGGASVLYKQLSSGETPDLLASAQPTQPAVTDDVQTDLEQTVPPETTQPQTTTVPDFTVYDLEGNPHCLSDYFGKPIILNFWASWCGPCKSEMPAFQAAYEQYGKDIHFLIVNMTDGYQETVDSAWMFIEDSGYTFPVFYDSQMDAAYTYGVTFLPTTLFIDKDGYLVTYAMSAISEDVLYEAIDMILPK